MKFGAKVKKFLQTGELTLLWKKYFFIIHIESNLIFIDLVHNVIVEAHKNNWEFQNFN